MKIYLQTQRMTLREFTDADKSDLLDLDSDPEVMRYLTLGAPSSLEEINAALIRIRDLYTKHQSRYGLWAAIEKQTGQFMGWFLFRPGKDDPNNTDRIEIGYRLKKSFWGQGFASEGCRAILEKGFREFNITEVFAIAMKDNLASRRVMEKMGLTYFKDYPDDRFPKEIIVEYTIQRNDWTESLLANRN